MCENVVLVEPVTLTSDVKQRNKEVNIIDPNPNNSYKTKKKFIGSYTEVDPDSTLTLHSQARLNDQMCKYPSFFEFPSVIRS